jgi:hypothetical protein
MNTETPVKNTFTVSIKTSLTPHLFKEIYLSLYANTLVSKAGLRAGVAYIDGNKTDSVACDLLEVSRMLLETAFNYQIDDANTLQQFSDFIQRKVIDFVQAKKSDASFDSNSLQNELAHCQERAFQECRFIFEQASGSYERFIELSELARTDISKDESQGYLSIQTQFLAARTFLMRAIDLFAEVLQDIKSSRECEPEASYQKFKAFAPLIWVANSLFDMALEEEIYSTRSLDKYLEAIRFQFPVLNSQSTAQDEHCIELLEQCLSEARAAGMHALSIRKSAYMKWRRKK